MLKKSNKRRTKTKPKTKTRKQKLIQMIGCSLPKNVNKKVFLSKSCSNCGKKHKCNCSKRRYKGGAVGCGASGCPIAPYKMNSFKGGNCNVCSQSGGNLPKPFVNSAWEPPVNKWPGIDGVPNSRNYFLPYNTNNNPQQQMSMANAGYNTPNSMVGGKNKKSSKKGGGLIPQDLVNLGRDFSFNIKSTYNALNGYTAPVDPTPYKQLTRNNSFIL
jgi:hypothetical protein